MRVAPGRRGVEVRHAPHAAVDVLAAADRDRLEHPRDRARGDDRVGDLGRRRAGRAEHDPPPAAPVDGADAQAPVEPRAPARDARAEVVERPVARSASGRAPRRARAPRPARRASAPPTPRARCPAQAAAPAVAQGAAQAAGRRRRSAVVVARAGRAGAAAGAPSAGRRGERPAARRAATIDPADVPTNASVRRRSAPVRVLDPGEHAGHPRLAEHPAAGEHEDVGRREHGHQRRP